MQHKQSFCNIYMSKNRLRPMSYYSMMKLFVSNKNVCDSWPIISLLLINNQAWIHLWNIQDLVPFRSIAIKTMSDGNSCMSIFLIFVQYDLQESNWVRETSYVLSDAIIIHHSKVIVSFLRKTIWFKMSNTNIATTFST